MEDTITINERFARNQVTSFGPDFKVVEVTGLPGTENLEFDYGGRLEAPIKTKIVRAPRTQEQRTKTYYDEDTIEHEIATRGGIKLDLKKEEHQRFLMQNPGAKTTGRSFSRFDPIYNKNAIMTVDQWFHSLQEEGVIPPQWDQSDFEAALTDRSRTGPGGEKYRGYKSQAADDTATIFQMLDAAAEQMGEGSVGSMVKRIRREGRPAGAPRKPPTPPAPPSRPAPPGSPLGDAERITRPQESKKGFLKKVRQLPAGFQTALTSEFTPLRRAERQLYKELGRELPELDMARKFEQQAGAHGKAEADTVEFKEKVFDQISDHASDFNSYLFLSRTRSRLKNNPGVKRVAGWTIQKAEAGLKELKDKVGDEIFSTIESVANNEYQQQMDQALKLQVSSGRMDQETYDKIKKANDFYAPFKVLKNLEETEGIPGAGRNISTTQAFTQAIKGIDTEDFTLGNMLEESAKQIYKSRILAEKNLKMLELDKLANMGGANNPFQKAKPDQYYRIHYKPAQDILHQLAMQQTANKPQLLEQQFIKVGRAIELADEVGLSLKKRALRSSLGRATVGGAETKGRVSLKAFTSEVIAHELGHAFDVPLRDAQGKIITKTKKVFGTERDIVQRLSTVINLRKGVPFGKRSVFQEELSKVVDYQGLGGTPKYRAQATERFAEFVDLYIHDPKQAKILAPTWTDYFEKNVLPKNKIKTLVERLADFYQQVDELPNIMKPLKELDDHNYLELAIRRAWPNRAPQLGVRFGTKPTPGNEILEYFKKGKKQAMEVPKEIAKAVQGLHRGEASVTAKFMALVALPMRLVATGANAAFQPVNLFFADLPRAALMSRYGIKNMRDAYQFPLDWIYSFYSSIRGNFGKPNAQYIAFLKSGAANSTMQRAFTPSVWKPEMQRGFARTVLGSVPKFSNAIEETAKVLGIRRGYRIEEIAKLPPDEAAERIRYIVAEVRNYSGSPDFLRGGQLTRSQSLENLNLLFMFFNARMQGNASDLARAAFRTGKKEGAWAWARFAPIKIAALTLALYNLLPGNREDYEKRAQWEKDNYALIPRPSYSKNYRGEKVRDYWRFPKREMVKLEMNLIEASVEFYYKRDPQALKDFALSFLENISPFSIEGENMQERVESVVSSANPLLKVPIEYGLGRDTFRHRDTIPQYIEGVPSRNLSPSEQYTRGTAEAFKVSGRFLGVSPLILEQATRGATAGLFTQFFPREQPGRSKIFSVPLVGPAASRFVGSQYLAFEENEELNQALIEQGDEKVRLNRQAEEIHEKWKQLPGPSYPLRRFVKDEGGDAATLAKVKDIISDERLGLDYGDRLIKQLQVGNGQRARYIASQLEGKSESERKEYLMDLRRKKILTPTVNQQLRAELWDRRRAERKDR